MEVELETFAEEEEEEEDTTELGEVRSCRRKKYKNKPEILFQW
jgi:hypothetical protein